MISSYINNSREYSTSPSNTLRAVKEEKKKKLFLMNKSMLLSAFEVTDSEQKLRLQTKSPTTETMRNSILALNYKRETGTNHEHQKKNHSDIIFSESIHLPSIINVVPPHGKIIGHRPCGRDGHSASIYEGKMIIFGGDRHKMSFNDIYVFNLDQAIKDNE